MGILETIALIPPNFHCVIEEFIYSHLVEAQDYEGWLSSLTYDSTERSNAIPIPLTGEGYFWILFPSWSDCAVINHWKE